MSAYSIPPRIEIGIQRDEFLTQLRKDGEEQNRPIISFYQAMTSALLDQHEFSIACLEVYRRNFGPIPEEIMEKIRDHVQKKYEPQDDSKEEVTETTVAKEPVDEAPKVYTDLSLLPNP